MHLALDEARRSTALASPNPRVGAVLVTPDAQIIASAHYTYDGVRHAEVIALEQAGSAARGATLYINLEPCSHQGRTGPCAEAVIRSGVRRVVIGMRDPNPLVDGGGVKMLRSAGIEIVEDVLNAECRKLNESFAAYIRTRRPLVTLKAGMTLDGKIAPPPEGDDPATLGSSTTPGYPATAMGSSGGWITSEEARAHVQQLRHASDSILVGVGTVVADDPLLTDRTGEPRRRPLLRVILDSRLRLPLDSRIVKTCHDDVLVFCSFAEEKKKALLEDRGVRVEQVPLGGPDGRPDLDHILARLGEMEIISLLIEGGALVNWTALVSGIVDKVFLYYAPKILAGTGAVPFAAGRGFRRMSEAAQVKSITIHRFGEDFAVEGYIRDPYSSPLEPFVAGSDKAGV
jgi:diaminohydroxyphosphoribosylaminopyrimidine deaminase / 5-amino-6-(5-phosphoribosylamino)uracil reductase